jgi:sugar (pentulose or hexulose) kinase
VTRGSAVILDVGKTNAKLTLWDGQGRFVARRNRANEKVSGPGYRALDAEGLEAWITSVLQDFAGRADVRAIVPVAHGAAAVLVDEGAVFAPPMDYEDAGGEGERAAYAAQRDPFAATGSPLLPQGLNLGFQLHRLEQMTGPWPATLKILPWPQYWAWRLSGVIASEVSSLGCHTDLWRPYEAGPSALSRGRGWAERLGPLRRAGDVLGPITPELARRTGLPADCVVHCGLHDSNAAFLAARAHRETSAADTTVLSTGTWFVAMRALGRDVVGPALTSAHEGRDCLVNVDVEGRLAPSARFMGGREAELIAAADSPHPTGPDDPDAIAGKLADLVAAGVSIFPTFAAGVGPFPRHRGRWIDLPQSPADRRYALGLYLALMADEMLQLVGARERLLIEGPFAEDAVLVRALATLRRDEAVYVSNAPDQVAHGALRLIWPDLAPPPPLRRVEPLDIALDAYRDRWQAAVRAEADD